MTEQDFWQTLGNRIRMTREYKAMTQAQLGDAIGASHVAVHNWERGKRHVDLWTLRLIERALDSWILVPG
jgi:DNA-binding XRE family transcriptional regulator